MSNRQIITTLLRPILTLMPKKHGVTALTFHNFSPDQFPWFESVVKFALENYEVIDPKDFLQGNASAGSDRLQVLFTFDDGFSSNIKLAKKCMSQYGIKGLFFLTEEFVGKDVDASYRFALDHFFPTWSALPLPQQQYAAMSWSDVEWLLDHGHSIGAHTRAHLNLSGVSDESILFDEVVASADRMEHRLGLELDSFAYPFGSIASVSKSAITCAMPRFSHGFSNVRGAIDESPSNHFLFRQNLVPNDPMWLVRAMIEGRLDWKYKNERDQSRQLVQEVGI